jgi:ABC-2 type transport system permease protein
VRPRWWWLALTAETRRFWSEIRTYWPGVVADAIITFSLFAVFVSLGDPGGAAWLGYTVWYLGATVMGEAAISISTDKQWGLLDQLRIKPIGLVTAMSVKTLVWTLFAAAQVVVVVGALTMLFDVPIHFRWTVLPIIALSLIGVFGFTFVVVALTILYTSRTLSGHG